MAEELTGIGVSPGYAVGPALVLIEDLGAATVVGAPEEEQEALDAAVAASVAQLETLAGRLRDGGQPQEAGIMEAQALMLQDPSLLDLARREIAAGQPAGEAMQRVAAHFQALFAALDDPYLAARGADVQDIAGRVQRNLQHRAEPPALTQPGIIIAHDLTPSQTAGLDRRLVRGIATDLGGPTAHTAILARALDIPAVVALGDITARVASGRPVALDGENGVVVLDPGEDVQAAYQARARARQEERCRRGSLRQEPAVTRDGRRITLAANIGSPADLPAAREVGAEGIGLFRTEFLFAERREMPSEEEQVTAYRAALEAMRPHTVVIRTLDVGGDKPLPYLPAASEANPFLGRRGIRYTLAYPDIFRAQLRALLRASVYGRLAIMFPMVSELGQIEAARALLAEAQAEVGGQAEIGIMVEVPAAALIADTLAQEVDFFSVGTNDLVQYTLAADRGNERVAALSQPLHPAVLRLLAQTARAAQAAGRWAGICGEMAGDELALPLLVGLGFDELSMTPSRIPAARERIRELGGAVCRELVEHAQRCRTADEVARLVREMIPC